MRTYVSIVRLSLDIVTLRAAQLQNEANMSSPEVKCRVCKQERERYDEIDGASGVLPVFHDSTQGMSKIGGGRKYYVYMYSFQNGRLAISSYNLVWGTLATRD